MFHLIPASLHRAGLRFAHATRKRYWRLAKPALSGVVVIALDRDGQVLLVRHSYDNRRWTLPGGGLRRGEDPAAAALREFAEELDCAVHAMASLGVHQSRLYGTAIARHVFAGELVDTPRPDGREVAEARFFARDALPEMRNSFVGECIAMLECDREP